MKTAYKLVDIRIIIYNLLTADFRLVCVHILVQFFFSHWTYSPVYISILFWHEWKEFSANKLPLTVSTPFYILITTYTKAMCLGYFIQNND